MFTATILQFFYMFEFFKNKFGGWGGINKTGKPPGAL